MRISKNRRMASPNEDAMLAKVVSYPSHPRQAEGEGLSEGGGGVG